MPKAKRKLDLPLDQAVALVRACQKLNCDTAAELYAMVERRCTEARELRDLLAQVRVAVKDHPDFQNRDKYLAIGMAVNKALS